MLVQPPSLTQQRVTFLSEQVRLTPRETKLLFPFWSQLVPFSLLHWNPFETYLTSQQFNLFLEKTAEKCHCNNFMPTMLIRQLIAKRWVSQLSTIAPSVIEPQITILNTNCFTCRRCGICDGKFIRVNIKHTFDFLNICTTAIKSTADANKGFPFVKYVSFMFVLGRRINKVS